MPNQRGRSNALTTGKHERMFDFGGAELLVIGLLAAVVLGPKELVNVLKVAGQFYRAARKQWESFKEGIEDIGREEELAHIAELRAAAAKRGRSLGRLPSHEEALHDSGEEDSAPPAQELKKDAPDSSVPVPQNINNKG